MNAEPIHLVKYIYGSTTGNSSKSVIPFSELNLDLRENKLLHSIWTGLDNNIFQALAKDLSLIPAEKIDSAEKEYIIILLVKSQNLTRSDFYQSLTKSGLRPLIAPKDRDKEQEKRYYPIITVCFTDITSLYTEEREKDDNGERDWNEVIYKTFDIDPRVKFLDSSIWNRFAPINSPHDKTFQFKKTLSGILKDIISYYRLGLYYSIASNTMLEFQMRMFVNSYIAKYSEKGHSSLVTPFKFHSESQMRRKAEQEINFLTKDWNGESLLNALNWRMLIVDDQAADSISILESKERTWGKDKAASKKDLIRRPLDQLYKKISKLDKASIDNKLVVDSIPKTILPDDEHKIADEDGQGNEPKDISILNYTEHLLKEKAYDIIFLDYLLGPKEDSETEREYGFQFLLDLLEDNRKAEPEFKYDYSGRYWIFPISSFPHALPDKLVQLGISHLHEIWHISQGGDPISTPHLYAYNLFRFIKQRISEYFLYPSAFRVFLNKAIIHCQDEDNKTWINTLKSSIKSLREKMNTVDDIYYDPFSTSLFINSIKWFLKSQKKDFFNHLLNTIDDLLNELSQGCNGERIDDLLNELTSTNKDYLTSLSILIRKVQEQRNKNIKIAQSRIKEIANLNGEQLDLSNLKLEEIPESIKTIERLEELNLSNNCISDIPEFLLKIEYLKSIDLRNNRLSEFPSILLELKDLKSIKLENNFIQEFPPSEVLKKLNLSKEPQNELLNTEERHRQKDELIKRNKVFISYSRLDMDWLEKIKTPHLDGLKNLGIKVEFWDDNVINPGKPWREEIEKALSTTKVALLLISGHFLNSEFIKTEELPLFFEAQEKKDLTIIPFHISPSLIELHPKLNKIQSFNDPLKPLSAIKDANEQENEILNLIRHLIKLMQE
jgi:hypothetical protein